MYILDNFGAFPFEFSSVHYLDLEGTPVVRPLLMADRKAWALRAWQKIKPDALLVEGTDVLG